MPRRPWLLPLLFIALTFSSPAQQVDASNTGGPTPLDAPWRLQFGDDPSYALPDFDDSHWLLHDITKDWASAGHKGYTGYAWYRMRVILPKGDKPLAIAVYPPDAAVDVYLDGARQSTVGRMRPEPVWTHLRTVYAIPVPAELNGRTVEVALRGWESPRSGLVLGAGGAAHAPLLGTAAGIERLVGSEDRDSWVKLLPNWTLDVVGLCVGFISFGLFLMQPQAREYAYAAAYLCGYALTDILYSIESQAGSSYPVSAQIFSTTASVLNCLLLLFIWGFIRAKADRLLYACLLAAWMSALSRVLINIGGLRVSGAYWMTAAMYLLLSIAIFVRLYTLARRGNRDAQLMFVPFSLWIVGNCILNIVRAFQYSGAANLNSVLILYQSPYFDITWQEFFTILSYFAIGAVLVLRYARSAKQEQRLRTEMEAARRVQGQLVPAELPQFAGFSCDAAYRAASEVGGDFYQVFPRPDGSALILVGDVSGKGLRAAMLGTLIVGGAGTLAQENLSAAEMLNRLNRHLHGRTDGGFATCLCALLAPDGGLTIANAGHLAPYRNGRELACDSGLPLGILPVAEYTETYVQLAQGDALTFMSDGVVEARSAAGELFGFDRTRDISAQSAQQIADAAARFGQEDDITVLTVRLSAIAATI